MRNRCNQRSLMSNPNEPIDKHERLKRQVWVGYLAALIFWSIGAYGLILQFVQSNELLALRIAGRPYISDFVNVYNAGVLGRMGRSVNIYDAKVQAAMTEKVVAPVVPEATFYLQAPPNVFVAFIPLSFFSPVGAWFVYCSLTLAANLLAIGWLAWKYFDQPFARTFCLAAAFASFPMWSGIRQGNSSLLLIPPLVLFWWLLQNRKFFAAGLATGLLLVKVQYLPFIGLIGLAIGGVRYLGGAVLSGLVVLGVSIAVLGLDNVLEWPRVLLHAETATSYVGVAAEKMQNIRGMIAALTGHVDTHAGKLISAIGCVVAGFGLGAVWWRKWSKRPELFEVYAALSTMIMLIFSIHTHSHDYVLMLLACLWLYVAAKSGRFPERAARHISRLAVSFPGISWPLFLLSRVPFLPFQPLAVFAVLLTVYVILNLRERNADGDALQEQN
jgi:hypothetical protein